MGGYLLSPFFFLPLQGVSYDWPSLISANLLNAEAKSELIYLKLLLVFRKSD